MQVAALLFSVLSFLIGLILTFLVASTLGHVRKQNYSVKNFRGHFSYITDSIDQLRDNVSGNEARNQERIESVHAEIIEKLKQDRTDQIREYDDLKFLLQKLQNENKS